MVKHTPNLWLYDKRLRWNGWMVMRWSYVIANSKISIYFISHFLITCWFEHALKFLKLWQNFVVISYQDAKTLSQSLFKYYIIIIMQKEFNFNSTLLLSTSSSWSRRHSSYSFFKFYFKNMWSFWSVTEIKIIYMTTQNELCALKFVNFGRSPRCLSRFNYSLNTKLL